MGDKEIFIEKCMDFIDSHSSEYADKVLISSVILKTSSGHWTNCLTLFRVLKKDEIIVLREEIRYDILILAEEIISLTNFKEIIKNLWHGFKVRNYDVKFDAPNFTWNYLPSHNEFSEWSGLYFEIANNPGQNDLNELRGLTYPLVNYEIPCYTTGYEAIKEWLHLREFHDNRDIKLSKALIFLPNFKGRIKTIRYNGKNIAVEIECEAHGFLKPEVQYVIKSESGIMRKNIKLDNKNETILDVVDEPIESYIQLVTFSGEKLDFYQETPYSHTGTIRFIRQSADKDIIKKINKGENDYVEFKPFVEKGDIKEEEIIKTVIAFSNTNGGSVLFGVDDYSNIDGVPRTIMNRHSIRTTEALLNYIDEFKRHWRKKISDKIDQGVILNFKPHKIGDKVVLEMNVEEVSSKPVSNIQSNEKFIRKGSTNRRPTTNELKLMLEQ